MELYDELLNLFLDEAPHFKVVSRFKDIDIDIMPKRGTADSAGYDLYVAEDIIIPSYRKMMHDLAHDVAVGEKALMLEEIASIVKRTGIKPTLVSTGVKAYIPKGMYLQLSTRSSTPLKYWLLMANAPAIIDADYFENESNEGEIFLEMINLSPFNIQLKKGDRIGQGIFLSYEVTSDDEATEERTGGYGSTGN